jgi:hypothetical protein
MFLDGIPPCITSMRYMSAYILLCVKEKTTFSNSTIFTTTQLPKVEVVVVGEIVLSSTTNHFGTSRTSTTNTTGTATDTITSSTRLQLLQLLQLLVPLLLTATTTATTSTNYTTSSRATNFKSPNHAKMSDSAFECCAAFVRVTLSCQQ